MNAPADILILDPDEPLRAMLGEYFDKLGYRVISAPDADAALVMLAAQAIPVVLVDLGPGQKDNMALIGRFQDIRPEVRVILVTGYPDLDAAVNALRSGAYDFVIKPFRLEDLRDIVARAIAASPEKATVAALQRRIAALESILREHGLLRPDDRATGGHENRPGAAPAGVHDGVARQAPETKAHAGKKK